MLKLIFVSLAREFAGVYTCVAEYEEGGEKHIIEINVTYFGQFLFVLLLDLSTLLILFCASDIFLNKMGSV